MYCNMQRLVLSRLRWRQSDKKGRLQLNIVQESDVSKKRKVSVNKVILPAVNPVTEQWQLPISCSDTSAGSTHASSSNYNLHVFACAPSIVSAPDWGRDYT